MLPRFLGSRGGKKKMCWLIFSSESTSTVEERREEKAPVDKGLRFSFGFPLARL